MRHKPIEERLQKLERVEEWKTLTNSGTNQAGFCYRKVGTDVEISIIMNDLDTSMGNGAWVALGYLPQEYRPKVKGITTTCIIYSSNASHLGYLGITNTNGEVTIRQMSGQTITAKQIRGFVKYSTL